MLAPSRRFPPAQVCEAMAQAKAGRREEALRLIRPLEEQYPNPGVTMQWVALVYAFRADEPDTVKWLKRSADLHEWPGFRALVKRIGLGE